MILDFKKLNENILKILDSEKTAIMQAKSICTEIVEKNTKLTKELKKELNENDGFDIQIGNFIKSFFIREEPDNLINYEMLTYEKSILGGKFEIEFYSKDSLPDIFCLAVKASKNATGFYIELLFSNDFFINTIRLTNRDLNKNIFLNNYNDEKSESYLSFIKQKDLTKMDSKENEDLFFLMFDYKLNLKEHPAFEVFKKGFESFINDIDLDNKNKLRVKI